MWLCLGRHGHCSAIGPVDTARHSFSLIVPCVGHHYGTLALSGTARRAAVPVPCHVVPVHVPCRVAYLENYNRKTRWDGESKICGKFFLEIKQGLRCKSTNVLSQHWTIAPYCGRIGWLPA